MFKLLATSFILAVSAQAELIQLCGDVKGLNNFPISRFDNVSVIELQTERPFPVLLHDKRDLEEAIKVVAKLEGLDEIVNHTSVRFSQDPDAVYPRFSNFEMTQKYFACATVNSMEGEVSFKQNRSFQLYLDSGSMLSPLYQRN